MLCEREELLFKVGANTILPPKQRNNWPKKSSTEWPNIPKYSFDKMVKWVSHDTQKSAVFTSLDHC